MKLLATLFLAILWSSVSFAQRPAAKSEKFDYTEVPTVPADLVRDIEFTLHSDFEFFNLNDLRRWGGNAAILKAGERLAGMSYYTLGREVALVESNPTIRVEVALGEGQMGSRSVKSEAVKGEQMTYWYVVQYNLPLTVQLRSVDGQLLDGFELPATVVVRYGNEKVSTRSTENGNFTYTRSKLDFSSELELEAAFRSPDAQRFLRRKAVLTQLSNLVDVLETRLYFNDVKASVNIASAKNRKVDYSELDAAQEQALAAFKEKDWDGLLVPMAVWESWLERTDLMNSKADVNADIARALQLNLAQAHLYRMDFTACAASLLAARGMTTPSDAAWQEIESVRGLLANRRKGRESNGQVERAEDAETFKAIDLKDVLGKRSENKDVDFFSGRDVYEDFTAELRAWQAVAEADAPEREAGVDQEMTAAQRLGNRLQQTIGGYMLSLNPLMDKEWVGQEFPSEIMDIERLVYLDISGMGFSVLPEELGGIGTLTTLNLTSNSLDQLPSSIGDLALLKKLILRGNPLESLPESLVNCKELRVLDLRGTALPQEEIARWMGSLPEGCKVRYDE